MQARKISSWEGMHQSRGIHRRRGRGLQVRRVRWSVDRARSRAWMSGRIGKGAFEALSMKRGPDEGNRDLRYWLLFQEGTRGRWMRKGSGVG